MSDIKTFPEMNKIIVNLLRGSGEAKQLYAAARIEELEAVLDQIWNRNRDEGALYGALWEIIETAEAALQKTRDTR